MVMAGGLRQFGNPVLRFHVLIVQPYHSIEMCMQTSLILPMSLIALCFLMF